MRHRLVAFAAALVLLAAVTLIVFRDLVRHPEGVLVGPQRAGWNDLTAYFIPLHEYPRQCCSEYRQWPLWNPFRNAGSPHLGNPQAALFYPPNWLCWCGELPTMLSWSLVLHHLVAGIGTYLLCRRYAFGWLASVTGGSIFLAAPYLVAQTGEGHYAQICAVAWMPWTLLAYESFRQARWWAIAPMSASLALSFLAGHVQEWFYVGLVLSTWVTFDVVRRLRAEGKRAASKVLASWLAVAVVTAGLVAVDLLPTLRYAGESARSAGLTAELAGLIGLSRVNLLQLLNPFALGGPDSYGGADKFFWETLCSFGIVPMVLALVGVWTSWRVYPIGRVALTAAVMFLFGFGSGSPVFRLFLWLVPGLDSFRAPSRVMFFCSLSVAVIAAAGVDAIFRCAGTMSDGDRRSLRQTVVIVCATLLMAMAGVAAFSEWDHRVRSESVGTEVEASTTGGEPAARVDERRAVIVRRAVERSVGSGSSYAWLLGACALAYLAMWQRHLARPATYALSLLSVLQLSHHAGKMLIVLPVLSYESAGAGQYYPPKELVVQASPVPNGQDAGGTPAPQAVHEPGSFRVLAPRGFWPKHRLQADRVCAIQGYEPIPLARHFSFMTALTGKDDPTSVLFGDSSPEMSRLRENLLDLSNVRFVVQHADRSNDVPDAFQWRRIPDASNDSLEPRSADARRDSFAVFENTDALPRAFVLGHTRVVSKLDDPLPALADLRPRDEVLMTAEFMPPGSRAQFDPAEIIEYTPNRVVVDAELSAVGYLILTDTWHPGWTATDNGRATSVIPANLTFRAVPLSAGKHRVILTYRPRGLATTALLSLVVWLGVLCALAINPRVSRQRELADQRQLTIND